MNGRIREKDLAIPTLQILAREPSGFASTQKLIQKLEDVFKPDGQDAEILANREDTYFSQKVRNMVSHRDTATSIIGQGYAVYLPEREGLQITDAGRAFISASPSNDE